MTGGQLANTEFWMHFYPVLAPIDSHCPVPRKGLGTCRCRVVGCCDTKVYQVYGADS